MSRDTLYFIMYLLVMFSVGMALLFIKDKKQCSIVLTPIAVAPTFLLAKNWLF